MTTNNFIGMNSVQFRLLNILLGIFQRKENYMFACVLKKKVNVYQQISLFSFTYR